MKHITILLISLPYFVLFYQCCKEPEEVSKPTVTTAQIEYDTADPTLAGGGGTVKDNGGAPVTEKGLCWNTRHNPSLSDYASYTLEGEGSGSFTSGLSALKTNTTYYVRAYATNKKGTAYGNEVSFTTTGFDIEIPCTETPTVTDYDGNVYATVKINGQCWMAENLRSTHYADGTPVEGYYSVNFDEGNDSLYGKLYTWYAAMYKDTAWSSELDTTGSQSICPNGWHIPNNYEWINYLLHYIDGYQKGGNRLKESGTTHWKPPNEGANNITGFTALPAGYIKNNNQYLLGEKVYYWTPLRSFDGSKGFTFYLSYNSPGIASRNLPVHYHLSVRCIKDK